MKNYRGALKSDNSELCQNLNLTSEWNFTDVTALSNRLFEGLNTPRALTCYMLLKHGEYGQLLNLDSPDSLDYLDHDADKFFCDVQATKFLSKLQYQLPGLDPELAAARTFAECETCNESENQFWNDVDAGRVTLTQNTHDLLERTRDQIRNILGHFCLGEWLDSCRLGPGLVAFGPKDTDVYVKLSDKLCCTRELSEYLPTLMESFPGWWSGLDFDGHFDVDVEIVEGGKYTQVPKSAKTNRNIETQPLFNGFLQLGLGRVIRKRLALEGVDLDSQVRNQTMAYIGSVTGKLATIDLSNASDMISKGVVRSLIPRDWLFALELCRTSRIKMDGEWKYLHRFSSMGNGYTFELESLIFLAICRAVCGNTRNVSVYGDDIIVPASRFAEVVRALECFGFKPNPNKSFGSGLFRESCGKDYFKGKLVRPYYFKEVPTNEPSVIRVANGLARTSLSFGSGYYLDKRLLRAVQYCHSKLSKVTLGRLARGYPIDDTYLFWHRIQSGQVLEFHPKKTQYKSYYKAKTALLYRMYLKDQKVDLLEHDGRLSAFKRTSHDGVYKVSDFDVSNWYRCWPPASTPLLTEWL